MEILKGGGGGGGRERVRERRRKRKEKDREIWRVTNRRQNLFHRPITKNAQERTVLRGKIYKNLLIIKVISNFSFV